MRSRWGVLISGNGSTLQSVIDCRSEIDIKVVISSGALAYGLVRAKRAGIPVEVLPEKIKKDRKASESWIVERLRYYGVRNIFLAGFMRIVSSELIEEFKGRVFNVHPSLLPKYKGLNAFEECLQNGDSCGGASVHEVVKEVDSGNIVGQRGFVIPSHRTPETSRLWLHINEQILIRESIRKILWQNRLI